MQTCLHGDLCMARNIFIYFFFFCFIILDKKFLTKINLFKGGKPAIRMNLRIFSFFFMHLIELIAKIVSVDFIINNVFKNLCKTVNNF